MEVKLGLFRGGATDLVVVTFFVALNFGEVVFARVGLSTGFFIVLAVFFASGGFGSFFCNKGFAGFFSDAGFSSFFPGVGFSPFFS